VSGKRTKRDRAAAAAVGNAPMLAAERALYQARIEANGEAIVDLVQMSMGSTGLPVPPGSVGINWAGAVVYMPKLQLQGSVKRRELLEALDAASEDQRIAMTLVAESAKQLALRVPGMLRKAADQIEAKQRDVADKDEIPSGGLILAP